MALTDFGQSLQPFLRSCIKIQLPTVNRIELFQMQLILCTTYMNQIGGRLKKACFTCIWIEKLPLASPCTLYKMSKVLYHCSKCIKGQQLDHDWKIMQSYAPFFQTIKLDLWERYAWVILPVPNLRHDKIVLGTLQRLPDTAMQATWINLTWII